MDAAKLVYRGVLASIVPDITGYVDVIHDLNVTPYPFGDNFADEIHFYHVLEHLDDALGKLEEIHRILKPGGMLYMRVPHFSSNGAFTDYYTQTPFFFFQFRYI